MKTPSKDTMELAIIDNYDSFTYNMIQIIEESGLCSYTIYTNDQLLKLQKSSFDKMLLSPGPGVPHEAGQLMDIVAYAAGKVPVLGICLGHEAIAMHYGCKLTQLDDIFHGVASPMRVIKNDVLFKNVPSEFKGGRYHSWVLDPASIPEEMKVIAVDAHNNIMAIKHMHDRMHGVQFHPESFLTPYGKQMMINWLRS